MNTISMELHEEQITELQSQIEELESEKHCLEEELKDLEVENMGLVDDKKLEAVANYIGEMEMYGDCVCYNFNDSLKENRIDVPCDVGSCEGDCPFYSKENFLNWIKKANNSLKIREIKRPKAVDFLTDIYEYPNNDDTTPIDYPNYAKALEKYCTDLENLFANLEYDLDNAECENRALVDKLSKIRGVIDGSH